MTHLTFRQLRALTTIYRSGTVKEAARRLNLTAPAVTLQVKQAEAELGVSLFDRLPGGMAPTEAGLIVIRAAERIDEQLRGMTDELKRLSEARSGSLRIGAVSTAKYFVPAMIAAFQREWPGIDIELAVGNRQEIIARLRQHDFDFTIMGRPPKDLPLRSAIIGEHPFVIIADPDHPLAGRRGIEKEEVSRQRFLVRERGSGTRISLEIFLSDIAERGGVLMAEMGSNESIKQAVMAGLGIAFISGHTIEHELQSKRLVILDVQGMPLRRQWFAVSHAERADSPSKQLFRRFLVREGAAMLPRIEDVSQGADDA